MAATTSTHHMLPSLSSNNNGSVTSMTPTLSKRGHKRSVSLENNPPPLMLRSTPSLNNMQQQQHPLLHHQHHHHMSQTQQKQQQQQFHQLQQLPAGHSGTLKSRNEQRRLSHKYGSHNNLEDDYTQQGRSKFQNIRQMFELSRGASTNTSSASGNSVNNNNNNSNEAKEVTMQSLPTTLATPTTAAATTMVVGQPQQQLTQTTRKTTRIAGCGSNIAEQQPHNDRLNISETRSHRPQAQQPAQPATLSQQPEQQTNGINHMSHHNGHNGLNAHNGGNSNSNSSNNNHNHSHQEVNDQAHKNFLRPIAFKPIPFEPDYRILSHQHYCEMPGPGDRYGYGSTPSLAPQQTSSLKFGSTTDLRHVGGVGVGVGVGVGSATSNALMTGSLNMCSNGGIIVGNSLAGTGGINTSTSTASGMGLGSGTGTANGGFMTAAATTATTAAAAASYMNHNHNGNSNSNSNYCNSLVMARRRGFRALKNNDSMESIGHTPELDAQLAASSHCHSQQQCNGNGNGNGNNTIHNNNNNSNNNSKSNGNGSGLVANNNSNNNNNTQHQTNVSVGNAVSAAGGNTTKYMLSAQCELTPSPSDSGISELEAALKDRDSELSYLRQTMEHNEKDKEAYWENETKRLKHFYEAQQREYLLKLKKMEQMLALQQFQLKQHKLRHGEQVNKLREQVADLKNELEILRNGNNCLKNSEHNLKDTVAYMDKQLGDAHNAVASLRTQLEDSEWKVCERNGEIALLKTQLKEANIEITMKDHAIVNLRHENTNVETQMYQSLHEQQQQHEQLQQQQQQQQQQQHQPKPNNDENDCPDRHQLNKIILLKDQVIVALTAELAKLRKELSDLAISHEYGEEPCGRYTRLKQQLDNLNEICQKTRKYTRTSDAFVAAVNCCKSTNNEDDEQNNKQQQLDAIMKRLQLDDNALMDNMSKNNNNNNNGQQQQQQQQQQLHHEQNVSNMLTKLEGSTLDTLIEESTTYAEDIAKLRQKLDDFRINLEFEKRQWCAEKDKVLNYQKQLQAHYINMYQKLRCLDGSNGGNCNINGTSNASTNHNNIGSTNGNCNNVVSS